MSEKLDFLAIGDITTDDFIELKDVRIDKDPDEYDQGADEICFRFGDKIEYEDHVVIPAVGNSPNAAVSAHRLGLSSALLTDMGDDIVGESNLKQLQGEGLNCDYIHIHEGYKSNYHHVLRFGPERTILVKHYEYPYRLPDFEVSPSWFYMSSVGENSLEYHEQIAEYVKNNETKLAFQPGTFQMKLFKELLYLFELADIMFANKEEYQRMLESDEEDVLALMKEMHIKGPKITVLTDGPAGAYAYDGENAWRVPMYPDPAPPVDRTGAGDAFSSTFTASIALGNDIPTALLWGPINSMAVVQEIGAQRGLLTSAELGEYLGNAPEDYKVEKIG